ncbi:uncharacterized protein LOC141680708 [Apium graveolens]|uniref:uncharacterized protein LOC141680708 n=1 Tax=Apium graveolens TaxID=4045 RepID=UPI003D7B35C2
MNLLGWNCRRLENPRTVRVLRDLVKDRTPDVLFLSEMISTDSRIESLCIQLGFSQCFSVDRVGHSSGLADETYWKQRAKLFWLEGDAITILFHSSATSRKKMNYINYLMNDAGERMENDEGMQSIIQDYYQTIFEASDEVRMEEAEINHINLVLIPKKVDANNMKDFRPIALCNVLYKILAKVLANCLKVLLSGLILENQSAFVSGRSITENVLIAFEVLHHMKWKKTGQEGEVALKLDKSKAYDRVDWNFLKNCLSDALNLEARNGVIHGYKSSQSVNSQKYGVISSSNVRPEKQRELVEILGVSEALGNSKYLGLLSLVGRLKKKVFGFIKDKVWKRIQGWKGMPISRGGRLVLIKNVI